MSISKKQLFVLALAAMVLLASSSVVLVLTGHEALVRDAFRWLSSSAESAALAVVVVVGFVVLVFST